jgi:hypothetical protein
MTAPLFTQSVWWPAGLVAAAMVLRLGHLWYYRDHERVLRHLGLRGDAERDSYYRSLDPVFAVFPFAWSWFEIFGLTAFALRLDHIASYIALMFLVATRLRAIQETGHTATHYGLCRQRRWQWTLSNLLFQYPCFKPDMHHRYISHVRQHHHHANEPDIDPNVVRFKRLGFLPGISRRRFDVMLLHPLTPRGFAETFSFIVTGVRQNKTALGAVVRIVVVAALVTAFVSTVGWSGLVLGFAIPMVTIYPVYSWISLLAEHRWFVECNETSHFARECVNGRPTAYPGALGWIVKHAVFPATDHYHLAHSLYPHIRWNHMAAIDRVLAAGDPRYGRYGSVGLLWQDGDRPSALSELRARMTSGETNDLASWASGLLERETCS